MADLEEKYMALGLLTVEPEGGDGSADPNAAPRVDPGAVPPASGDGAIDEPPAAGGTANDVVVLAGGAQSDEDDNDDDDSDILDEEPPQSAALGHSAPSYKAAIPPPQLPGADGPRDPHGASASAQQSPPAAGSWDVSTAPGDASHASSSSADAAPRGKRQTGQAAAAAAAASQGQNMADMLAAIDDEDEDEDAAIDVADDDFEQQFETAIARGKAEASFSIGTAEELEGDDFEAEWDSLLSAEPAAPAADAVSLESMSIEEQARALGLNEAGLEMYRRSSEFATALEQAIGSWNRMVELSREISEMETRNVRKLQGAFRAFREHLDQWKTDRKEWCDRMEVLASEKEKRAGERAARALKLCNDLDERLKEAKAQANKRLAKLRRETRRLQKQREKIDMENIAERERLAKSIEDKKAEIEGVATAAAKAARHHAKVQEEQRKHAEKLGRDLAEVEKRRQAAEKKMRMEEEAARANQKRLQEEHQEAMRKQEEAMRRAEEEAERAKQKLEDDLAAGRKQAAEVDKELARLREETAKLDAAKREAEERRRKFEERVKREELEQAEMLHRLLKDAIARSVIFQGHEPKTSVAILIDHSSSMGWGSNGGKWPKALEQARLAIDIVGLTNGIATRGSSGAIEMMVIAFNHSHQSCWHGVQAVTKARVDEARTWLTDRCPLGGTDFKGPLRTALDAGVKQIFFLTDGLADLDASVYSRVRDTGTEVVCVKIGEEDDAGVLTKLAEAGGTELIRVRDLK